MLYWCCNPDNPTGASLDERIESLIGERPRSDGTRDVIVADLAYEPFRTLLEEDAAAPGMKPPTWLDHVLQLWSPNKLHGLTGVRGAYLILPMAAPPSMEVATLKRLAPSWVLGADGVALLEAHTRPEAAAFLLETAPTLRSWKRQQERMLVDAGWQAQASPLHYGLWKPPIDPTDFPRWIAMLRVHAIKVRDARSFGRPGWVRLVCREPEEVQELVHLTDSLRNRR
jgi:histidinol-phosphate aminotransferase